MSARTEYEKELYEFLDDMDPTGRNTQRMKNYLKPMSDKEFYKYVIDFLEDNDKYIQVGYEPFNNPVNVEFIEKVAKKHNIPLYEYVYKPYVGGDPSNPPATVHPVLVVDIPIKRLKQTVMNKSHTNTSTSHRDSKTGQIAGHDKTARVSDAELFSLASQGLYMVAQEEFGVLSDNAKMGDEMIRSIQQTGEFNLEDLTNDPKDRTTLNTIYYYALAAGIVTNLVESSGYVLNSTMEGREVNKKAINRKEG